MESFLVKLDANSLIAAAKDFPALYNSAKQLKFLIEHNIVNG